MLPVSSSSFSPGSSPSKKLPLFLSYTRFEVGPDVTNKPSTQIIDKAQKCLFEKLKTIVPYRNIKLEDLVYCPDRSGKKHVYLSKDDYDNDETDVGYEVYFKHPFFWTMNTIVYSNIEGTSLWPSFPNHVSIPSSLIEAVMNFTVKMVSEPPLADVTVDACILVEKSEINYGGKDPVNKNWYHISLSLPPPHSMKWIVAIDEQKTKIYNLMNKQVLPIVLQNPQ